MSCDHLTLLKGIYISFLIMVVTWITEMRNEGKSGMWNGNGVSSDNLLEALHRQSPVGAASSLAWFQRTLQCRSASRPVRG